MHWNPDGRKGRKLWEQDKNRLQILWINFKVKWRIFQRETRGMGLLFILMVAAMLVINLVPDAIRSWSDSARYSAALKKECTNEQFYAWNFKDCEDVDTRPAK